MTYLLKTESKCNNNCIYCESIKRKVLKKKSLTTIKNELEKAAKNGFESVRMSCNTDTRKDFLKIIDFAFNLKLKIILETNGRIFAYKKNVLKVDKYIHKYELYFSFTDSESAYRINQTGEGFFEETIIGIKNILASTNNKDKLLIKTVILTINTLNIFYIIDTISTLGVVSVKFVYPFKYKKDDAVPGISWVSGVLESFKKYSSQNGLKVILGDESEYNPFFEEISKFLNTEKSKIKIEKRIFKTKPHFSVIIPTYNKAKTLPHVLRSFFNQDFKKSDYEIIIVDDGSDDKTEEEVRKIVPTCNMKYIYWPRLIDNKKSTYKNYAKFYNRAGQARNLGLKFAEGNIILFNDADIVVDNFCLKKHNDFHQERNDLVIRGFRMFLANDFKLTKKSFNDFTKIKEEAESELPIKKRIEKCRYYNLIDEGWSEVITANLSIRKNNIDLVGSFSNDSPFWGYEDVEFGYKLKLANLKLMWSDRIKVFHLPHEKQSGDIFKTMSTFWINTNILYRKYLDKDIYELYKEVVLKRLDDKTMY